MLAETNAADVALARAEWQPTVFSDRPRRVALLELEPRWQLQNLRLSFLRNHAVEPTVAILRPFLAYAGLAADVSLSAYDDSLSNPPARVADVHVVWLDASRYTSVERHDAALALGTRLGELRGMLEGPMLLVESPPEIPGAGSLNAVLQEAATRLPDVHLFPYASVIRSLGVDSIETRPAAMGTQVAGEAAMRAAQHLGLGWIPAMVRPRLKAVVTDLDNTLIGGVLGEDGARDVVTEGGYAQIRERLLQLHREGVLLALVTKNDPVDVARLFAQRAELSELGRAFAVIEASWRSKAEGVQAAAQRLHIDVDSLLVIDDNPGEVAAMAGALRDPWFVVAREPELTTRALALHPGLVAVRHDVLGSKRAADLVAAERRRAELPEAADAPDYLRSLQMVAHLSLNAAGDRARASELSRKTNQFNTTLRRFNETDVEGYIAGAGRCAVSIRLRDRFSDSGMIGVLFARRDGDLAVVDEIAVSCRALGRSIEGVLLDAALSRIVIALDCARLVIPFTAGPRNEPARTWLTAVADARDDGSYEYRRRRGDGSAASLELHWEDDGARRQTA